MGSVDKLNITYEKKTKIQIIKMAVCGGGPRASAPTGSNKV
jgi:hypothetical protein